jgi:hypothetical protein
VGAAAALNTQASVKAKARESCAVAGFMDVYWFAASQFSLVGLGFLVVKRPSPAVAILGWPNGRHNFSRPNLQAQS